MLPEKVVIIIPIKSSSRVPNKNFLELDGESLILRAWRKCQFLLEEDTIQGLAVLDAGNAVLPEQVLVFADESEGAGPHYMDQTVVDVATQKWGEDIGVITVHCTSPFLSISTLRTCVQAFRDGHDSVVTVQKKYVFLWDENQKPLYQLDNRPCSQDHPPIYEETSGLYGYLPSVVRGGRRLGDNPKLQVVSPLEALDLDWPEDWELIRAAALGDSMLHISEV